MKELPIFSFFIVAMFGNLDQKIKNIHLLTLLMYTEPMISKIEELYYNLFQLVTKCFRRLSNFSFL